MSRILNMSMPVDVELLPTLKEFAEKYVKAGNGMRPLHRNDADQVLIEFSIASPEAAVWLYAWIHKYKFDGDKSKDRDSELEWITGTSEFRELVYAILYNGKYQPAGMLDTIKFKG